MARHRAAPCLIREREEVSVPFGRNVDSADLGLEFSPVVRVDRPEVIHYAWILLEIRLRDDAQRHVVDVQASAGVHDRDAGPNGPGADPVGVMVEELFAAEAAESVQPSKHALHLRLAGAGPRSVEQPRSRSVHSNDIKGRIRALIALQLTFSDDSPSSVFRDCEQGARRRVGRIHRSVAVFLPRLVHMFEDTVKPSTIDVLDLAGKRLEHLNALLRRCCELNLEGTDTLFNTYWIRANHKDRTHRQYVEQTKVMFQAAREAGVRRIVHISITNPDPESDLPYFQGKGQLEDALRDLEGVSHAILRPTVIYIAEDIPLNIIAWTLHQFPVVLIPGRGKYEIQPVFVEDLAALAIEVMDQEDNLEIDAVGPEVYSYTMLIKTIRSKIGAGCAVMPMPSNITSRRTVLHAT